MFRNFLCSLCLSTILLKTTVLKAQSRPSGVVLAYSASWRDADSPPKDFNYAAITHLARSFVEPHADGSVTVAPEFFNPAMEQSAHAAGVKLLISLGGAADSPEHWVALASHPETLNHFCDELQKLLTDHHYDGIDIDWEPAPLNDSDAIAYATLVTTLRAKMPKIALTTALPASDYWIGHMQWDKVLPALDYVNVMTYDYAGGWGGIAGHGSNLFPPTSYPPTPEYSADEGITNLIDKHHLPKGKVLLGMNFWGYRFAAAKIGDTFPKNEKGYADSVTYADVQGLLRFGNYRSYWDEGAKMPYIQRITGASTISYENPESIRQKCEYAKAHGLAGVMIWHIGADQDGDHAPLLDAVAQSFGVPAMVQTQSALEDSIAFVVKALDALGTPHADRETASLNERYVYLKMQLAQALDSKWQSNRPTSKPAN